MTTSSLVLDEVEERVSAFMEGLEFLSRKTGVFVDGCGCCGSPYLKVDGCDDYKSFEDIEVGDDGWELSLVDRSGDSSHKYRLNRSGKTQIW